MRRVTATKCQRRPSERLRKALVVLNLGLVAVVAQLHDLQLDGQQDQQQGVRQATQDVLGSSHFDIAGSGLNPAASRHPWLWETPVHRRPRGPRSRRNNRRGQRGRAGKGRGGGKRHRLSRNITMVLENLLKDYERSRPPTQAIGRPAVVRTNILIRSMGPISERGMDYSMDCYFRQYWRDARLSFSGPINSLSLSIKMLERIWRPDTYFYNGKQSYVHTITVPNKLLRLASNGDIIYSMRLTIKATCPMELQNFPMDKQSCPLIIGSYAYPSHSVVYEWLGGPSGVSVDFVPGMALSQFDLMGAPHRNFTITRRDGEFSVLQVNFNLRRNTGYFLIQVYVPCILIVVLSWVSFWIHREATSDRVGLGITTVLTLSTISLDSRKDLPKVRHATALDWFLLMSFLYCIATLLQFAAVHYFTKVGSGEIYVDEDDLEDADDPAEDVVGALGALAGAAGATLASAPAGGSTGVVLGRAATLRQSGQRNQRSRRRHSSLICPIVNDEGAAAGTSSGTLAGTSSGTLAGTSSGTLAGTSSGTSAGAISPSSSIADRRRSSTPFQSGPRAPLPAHLPLQLLQRATRPRSRWKQALLCLAGDESFRRQRERAARVLAGDTRHVNSVSSIDRFARVLFPVSFVLLNLAYWVAYGANDEDFSWGGLSIYLEH